MDKVKKEYKVIGIRPRFTSKKNNKDYVVLHVAYKSDGVDGHATKECVLSADNVPNDLKVNDLVHLNYGWGYKVSSVECVGK